jgi:hypothetical protein
MWCDVAMGNCALGKAFSARCPKHLNIDSGHPRIALYEGVRKNSSLKNRTQNAQIIFIGQTMRPTTVSNAQWETQELGHRRIALYEEVRKNSSLKNRTQNSCSKTLLNPCIRRQAPLVFQKGFLIISFWLL